MSMPTFFDPSTRHGSPDFHRSHPRHPDRVVSRARNFIVLGTLGLAVLGSLVGWTRYEGRRWQREDLPQLRALSSRLHLSDLALWTEARYTRHPSQADLFSAFQDSPGAPEHFPAGSIVSPSPVLSDPLSVVASRSGGRLRDAGDDGRRRVCQGDARRAMPEERSPDVVATRGSSSGLAFTP